MSSVNLTRRQHYVPQAYLRHWGDANGKLAVSINGSVVPSCGTTNFAVEVDLYSFVDLSSAELGFLFRTISQIITPENPIVDAVVVPIFLNVLYFRCEGRDWTEEYRAVFDEFFPWIIREDRINAYQFLRRVAEGNAELRQEHIDIIERETLSGFETLMTGIESAAWPIIDSLLTNGVKCLKEGDNLRCLLLYLVNQCFRGPDYLRYIESVLPERAHEIGETPKLARYLRYIFPFYVLNQLLQTKDQRKVHIIENRTDLEFVTGDVPCAIYGESRNPKTPMITYFPISPRNAILFGYREAINKYIQIYGWELRDKKLVDWFNREVVASSQRFVFASSADVLIENDYHVHQNSTPSCVR